MAVVACIGNELNSVTAAEEYTSIAAGMIDGTSQIDGTYSLITDALVSGTPKQARFQFAASAGNVFYSSFLFKPSTLPTADNAFFVLNDANSVASPIVYLTIGSSGEVKLFDEDGQIGSASSNLATGTTYFLQVAFDRSGSAGSHVVRGYIDGVEFAGSSTRSISAGIFTATWGGNLLSEAQTTGVWYVDSQVVNDNGGSFSTLPSAYRMGVLRPSAAGDSNQWNDTSNAAGTGNNYQLVDETNPNDATDFVQSGTANDVDLYNVSNSGINSYDTVAFAAVAVRYRNNTADATTAFRVIAEKTASGTKSESSDIVPNSTAWQSNSNNQPRVAPLIMYTDPDGAAWTQTTLDSMQIGVKLTVANVNRVQVTALWTYFVYSVGTPPSSNTGAFFAMFSA